MPYFELLLLLQKLWRAEVISHQLLKEGATEDGEEQL